MREKVGVERGEWRGERGERGMEDCILANVSSTGDYVELIRRARPHGQQKAECDT